jgi:hypothetical protein
LLGRRNHADRQARYRRRQKQKVTHHTPQQAEVAVPPCRSGPAFPLGFPDKEDSDVCNPALPIPSLAPVCACPATPPSPVPPPSCPPPTLANDKESQQYLCHFCLRTRSRFLRREFLVEQSRRHLGRRDRRPP